MDPRSEEVLTVSVGSRWYGVPVASVRRVAQGMRIIPITSSSQGSLGVVCISGEVFAAFDLCALTLGHPVEGVPTHVFVDVVGETIDLLVAEVGPVVRGGTDDECSLLDVATVVRTTGRVAESA